MCHSAADDLRVAIDHHGLIAGVSQGEAGMDTAIIKLDPLADPIGAGPQYDDAGLGRGGHLGLVLEGPIHVGSGRFKLRGAGIDGLERSGQSGLKTPRPDHGLLLVPKVSNLTIGKPKTFGFPQELLVAS